MADNSSDTFRPMTQSPDGSMAQLARWLNRPIISPAALDHEGGPSPIDRFLRLGNVGYTRAARPLGEVTFEFLERDRISNGVHLNVTVQAVLGVSAEAKLDCPTFGEVAEAHALHSA